MASTETMMLPASSDEMNDTFVDRTQRLAAERRRADWGACVRANRAVGGALHRAEQANESGNRALARLYREQARRRAWVAARLIDRYDAHHESGDA